jgi:ATP-dependent protease ClpP protease subunit
MSIDRLTADKLHADAILWAADQMGATVRDPKHEMWDQPPLAPAMEEPLLIRESAAWCAEVDRRRAAYAKLARLRGHVHVFNRAGNFVPRPTLRNGRTDWYKIDKVRNLGPAGGRAVDVFIYDEIGYYGVTASAFASELAGLDVDTINLRLNSPGGEVFDGIAIYNVLRGHRAAVNVTVDGLAASIASVIAMAGDSVEMGRGSRMMIHDAQGLALGDAATMRELADLLDQESDNIARFYAARAGGKADQWRERMRATTWYTAEEAVEAGLADRIVAEVPAAAGVPTNTWDLRMFGEPKPRSTVDDRKPEPVNRDPEPAEPTPAADDEWDEFATAWNAQGGAEQFRTLVDHAASNLPEVVTPAQPDAAPVFDEDDLFVLDFAKLSTALEGGLK